MSLDVREVAKTLYKKDVEITEGQNPLEVLTKLQEDFVNSQKEIAESKYKYGYKNGAIESEKSFKTALGIDDDLSGAELTNLAKERYETALSSKGASAEEIKKLKDDYNAKIKSFEENRNTIENEWKEKHDVLISKIANEQRENQLNTLIASDLSNTDLNWNTDAELKSYQIGVVKDQLSKINYKQDGNVLVVVNPDGSVKTDSLGNQIRFEEEKSKILRAIVGTKSGASTPSFSASSQLSTSALKEKLNTLEKGSEEYIRVNKLYVDKLYNT